MKTRFVLINTSHAGNVGAAARAMKVMGFDDLVLVAPRWPNVLRKEETIQRASGALDVLEKARVVATLDEALDGMSHLCATAMTPRDFGPPTVEPRVHFEALLKQERLALAASAPEAKNASNPAGGGEAGGGAAPAGETACPVSVAERFGMTERRRRPVPCCAFDPDQPAFRSLNLGAAMQRHRLRLAPGAGGFGVSRRQPRARVQADAAQVAGMLGHREQALTSIGFLDPAAPKKLMPRLNQLFQPRATHPRRNPHLAWCRQSHDRDGAGKALDCVSKLPTRP